MHKNMKNKKTLIYLIIKLTISYFFKKEIINVNFYLHLSNLLNATQSW